MFEEQRRPVGQSSESGWVTLGTIREAGRGRITEGLVAHGEAWGFHSSNVIRAAFKIAFAQDLGFMQSPREQPGG